MKVVQINAVYGTGSTGHIAEDIHKRLLLEGYASYVFWGTKCVDCVDDDHIIRIGGTLSHLLHSFLWRIFFDPGWHSTLATKALCRKLDVIKPDVVHLHNIHGSYVSFPVLAKYLLSHNIPTILTLHDCWFFTGYCTYFSSRDCYEWLNRCEDCPAVSHSFQKRRINFIFQQKSDQFSKWKGLRVIGVSRWIADESRRSPLLYSASHDVIYNWVDLDTFKPADEEMAVRSRYHLPSEKKIILGVSQCWSERKGLRDFVELSKALSQEATVVLVGQTNVETMPTECGIVFVGFTESKQELAQLYSAADAYVNPSRMETFGLTTAEAMACGTPVVAYDNTGMSELIPQGCGVTVPDGNTDQLIEAVRTVIKKRKSAYIDVCRSWACATFCKTVQIGKYMHQYEDMICR